MGQLGGARPQYEYSRDIRIWDITEKSCKKIWRRETRDPVGAKKFLFCIYSPPCSRIFYKTLWRWAPFHQGQSPRYHLGHTVWMSSVTCPPLQIYNSSLMGHNMLVVFITHLFPSLTLKSTSAALEPQLFQSAQSQKLWKCYLWQRLHHT